MKASVQQKIENLCERYQELGLLLGEPEIIRDQNKFRAFSKEYSNIEPIVKCFTGYKQVLADIASAKELLDVDDQELKKLAQDEIALKEKNLLESEDNLKILLLPKDPNDDSNTFLEIRAGAGGDEAAIFVGDLFRMYSRYAQLQNWQIEIINSNEGEHGGFKEIIARIIGKQVYAKLKFESGAHRVQRVPETEAQGRIHTSTCTVAILPEVKEIDEINIDTKDLRVDTYRASGAGGQHINKTESAIRITHIPTGVIVECQDERSQHKNRARAMALLQAKLLAEEQRKQKEHTDTTRRNLVGTGDRSERIRTYNFPQGRVTDHRINLTLYKLEDIMQGNLAGIIEPLIHEHQADLLAHEISG